MSSRSDKTPLQRLLDIGIYAPLGYVLTRKKTRQELIKAGRKQIAFSRSLGKAALEALSRRSGSAANDRSATERPTTSADATDEPNVAATEAEPTEPEATPADAEEQSTEIDATIGGYDDMTAKEIIALVGDASQAQVMWIQQREMTTKERVTVLRAADKRLQALS